MSEITVEKIQEWKTKYGRVKKIKIAEIEYYYRPLFVDEYNNIQKVIEGDTNAKPEIETIKIATLAPDLPIDLPAGLVITLSEEILKLSGFGVEAVPQEL